MPHRTLARLVGVAVLLALLLVASAAPIAAGGPVTRWVDKDGRAGPSRCDGTGPARRGIQRAVNEAAPGDRILVCPGTWTGQLFIDTPRLTVRAVEPWTATILAARGHPTNNNLVHIRAPRVRFQWFDVRARSNGPCEQVGGLVLVLDAPRSQVRANHLGTGVTDTLTCGFESGVRVVNSDDVFVGYNTIRDFLLAGVEAAGSDRIRVTRNSVRYLHASEAPTGSSGQVGIIVQLASDGIVRHNVVRSLATGGDTTPLLSDGVSIRGDGHRVQRNRVWHAQSGIVALETSGARIGRNQVEHAKLQGIVVGAATDGRIFENRVFGAGRGLYLWTTATGFLLRENDATGNGTADCFDQSTGAGTAGTANAWIDNVGDDDSPDGICEPA